LKKLVAFNKRIDSVETELRELKVKDDSKQSSSVRGSYNQGFNRGGVLMALFADELDKFNSIARISLLKVSKSLTVSYIC
jgi:hypothetical protein